MISATSKRVIPCEVYSRVVGYLRPVQYWNAGKQQEFKDRVNYTIDIRTDRKSEKLRIIKAEFKGGTQ